MRMRTINPKFIISFFRYFSCELNAWHRSFVGFTFGSGARMTGCSKVFVDADRFLCRQQFCRERNILTNICDRITRCRNQLQTIINSMRSISEMETLRKPQNSIFASWLKILLSMYFGSLKPSLQHIFHSHSPFSKYKD